jgi:glucose 1-dehydrogenase
MSQALAGQVAIVTGSDSGIGQATAVEFAREGAAVLITYLHDRDGAESTRRQVQDVGSRAAVVQADVSKSDDVEQIFVRCTEELGPPTILVNNAGVDASGKRIDEMSLETWERAIETNLTGPFLCCRRFVQQHKQRRNGTGRIINVSSVHQDIPRAGAADYDASKGGIRNLTTTLALELAQEGITVNTIAPGMVLTPMNREALEDPKKREEQVQSIPMKRAAEPWEVARLAVYLASRDAAYVTGATFVIDGGLMLNQGQGA